MNYSEEFKKYATKHHGVNSMYYDKIVSITAFATFKSICLSLLWIIAADFFIIAIDLITIDSITIVSITIW